MKNFDLEHFGQIIQQTSDAIFSTDQFFIIKTWNTAAEHLYGFTYDEVVGSALGQVLKSNSNHFSDDLIVLQEKGFCNGDYDFKNKHGKIVSVNASIKVLKNADETISGYVGIHRNINDRKKREEDLKTFTLGLEVEVKKQSKQLIDIFERITEAFVALDNDGCYTYVNAKAGEMLGRDPTSLLGKHIWTEFPEGLSRPFSEAYMKAMKEQHYIHLEDYHPVYDRWFENHIYPSPEGLSIFFKDISDIKKAEEQIRLSAQRLTLHLTSSPLAVIEWDVNSVITSWSSQAEIIFGWTNDEVVGKNVEELGLIYKDDVDNVKTVIKKLIDGSTPRFVYANRNYTKNGNVIFCEWYNSALKDHHNNFISCMSLVQDITEKRTAEQTIAFNEKQLDLIYNSGSDILYLVSVEPNQRYKFVTVNNAFKKATSLMPEQIVDKYVEEVIPFPSSQLVLSKYDEAIEKKTTVTWEEVTAYPSGVKTGFVSVTPIYNTEGNCIRLVGSVHDITENKRAEAELIKKNNQLRELSAHLQEIREEERANIAREIHDELGERLTGLKLEVSWMQQQLSSSNEMIKEKFPRLIQLVDDTIKTVRRISTDLRPSILDDFGLVEALEWQAVEFEKRTGINCQFKSFLKENVNNKKIEITLFRIFQESLTNVVRHANAKNVSAQLLKEKNNIELTIIDDGVGMDLNDVQNKKTLGLIGMKERIAMVNGQYSIASKIGEGTTITVFVPYHNNNQ